MKRSGSRSARRAMALAPHGMRTTRRGASRKGSPSSGMVMFKNPGYHPNPSGSWADLGALAGSAVLGNIATEYAVLKYSAYAQKNGKTYTPAMHYGTKIVVAAAGIGGSIALEKKHKTASSVAFGIGLGALVSMGTDLVNQYLLPALSGQTQVDQTPQGASY